MQYFSSLVKFRSNISEFRPKVHAINFILIFFCFLWASLTNKNLDRYEKILDFQGFYWNSVLCFSLFDDLLFSVLVPGERLELSRLLGEGFWIPCVYHFTTRATIREFYQRKVKIATYLAIFCVFCCKYTTSRLSHLKNPLFFLFVILSIVST